MRILIITFTIVAIVHMLFYFKHTYGKVAASHPINYLMKAVNYRNCHNQRHKKVFQPNSALSFGGGSSSTYAPGWAQAYFLTAQLKQCSSSGGHAIDTLFLSLRDGEGERFFYQCTNMAELLGGFDECLGPPPATRGPGNQENLLRICPGVSFSLSLSVLDANQRGCEVFGVYTWHCGTAGMIVMFRVAVND